MAKVRRQAGQQREIPGGPVPTPPEEPTSPPGPSWSAWRAGAHPDLSTRLGCLEALSDLAAARMALAADPWALQHAAWTIGRALSDHTRVLLATRKAVQASPEDEPDAPEPAPAEAEGVFERMIREGRLAPEADS